jgi:hypothetical protein
MVYFATTCPLYCILLYTVPPLVRLPRVPLYHAVPAITQEIATLDAERQRQNLSWAQPTRFLCHYGWLSIFFFFYNVWKLSVSSTFVPILKHKEIRHYTGVYHDKIFIKSFATKCFESESLQNVFANVTKFNATCTEIFQMITLINFHKNFKENLLLCITFITRIGIHRDSFADVIVDLRNCYSQSRLYIEFTTNMEV